MAEAPPEFTCRDLADFLIDYTEGTLPPRERRRFEEHLAECPDCVRYLTSYREAVKLAQLSCDDDSLPAGVPEQLVRAILAARTTLR